MIRSFKRFRERRQVVRESKGKKKGREESELTIDTPNRGGTVYVQIKSEKLRSLGNVKEDPLVARSPELMTATSLLYRLPADFPPPRVPKSFRVALTH